MFINKKIFALISLTILLTIPVAGLAIDFGTPPTVRTNADPNAATFITDFLGKILDYLWIIFIAFAVIMFMVAGFQFLTARGEAEGYGKAQKAVLWGVVGVIIAVAAFTIPFFIKNTISSSGNSNCDNGAWRTGGYASEDDCYNAYGGR